MSVPYEDAIATLQSMFPQWERGTLGAVSFIDTSHKLQIPSTYHFESQTLLMRAILLTFFTIYV